MLNVLQTKTMNAKLSNLATNIMSKDSNGHDLNYVLQEGITVITWSDA